MNPFMKPFCKQNPIFKQECPLCKKQLEFKSLDFFENDIYETKCPLCNKNVAFEAKEIADGIEKSLKAMGVRLG